jgi:hypothetical protein
VRERLRKVEEEVKTANELFAEIVKKPEMLSKLKEMFELARAMEENPELRQRLMDLRSKFRAGLN